MNTYWLSIEVHLGVPLALVQEEQPRAELVGFVQELACTAEDVDAARRAVEAHVASYDLGPDQRVEIRFDAIEEVAAAELDEDLLARATQDPALPGVWFTTGRSFYSEDR